jgi:putative ABC transport system permease protein
MRLYRWLLRLCSPWFAREYGAAMEETFARRLADARRISRGRVAWVWQREIAGLLVVGIYKVGNMEAMVQETSQAAHRLWRSPAFSIATILTLALAIGANAAMFTVVQRVVLNPLPYSESDRLIELDHGALKLDAASGLGMTSGLYFHYLERSRTLDGAALYRTEDLTITGDGEPARLRVARATPSIARVLRVTPALGRWFSDEEGVPGGARAVVLSHGLWARRYHNNPDVLEQPVMLGGEPMRIVGVMPASFAFPDPLVELWIVEALTPSSGFGLWTYNGVARVRVPATIEDVRAELNGLIPDVALAYPSDPRALGNVEGQMVFSGRTLKQATIGGVERGLWILLTSVGLVLLVACANVANLFLVRSEARQRDVAVRRALGATGSRIARYFLTESALLSAAGGATGLALAWGALRLVVGFAPANLPRLPEIHLDAATVAFTVTVTLLAACVFGAIPLWRGAELTSPLHEHGRGNTASRGRHHARHVLMGTQVSLALVLLVSSGLMMRSFQMLRATDPGFDARSALTFSIGLPERTYPSVGKVVATHHEILDRLSALPGVTATSASSCLPLHGACHGNTLRVEGRTYDGTIPPIAVFRAVAGGYFDAMGMRLLRGRAITRDDVDRQEPVVVVSEALAKRFFPNENPLGRRVASNRPPAAPGEPPPLTWLLIVGVVADTPTGRLLGPANRNPLPQVYMPMSIAGGPGMAGDALVGPDVSVMSYVVRTPTPPLELLPVVRRTIDALDLTLALAQPRTLQDLLDRASAQMAFTMVLLAVAAVVALVLGAIGIYGVMSYLVGQRTNEIGVRLALGADPRMVTGHMVRQGGIVASVGLAVGLAVAFAGSRFMESLLFGVSARDPGVFAATTLTLLAISLVACWLPARRASRLSPLDALRTD